MCGHACTLPQKHNPTFSQLGNREFCARLWSHILLRQSEKTNNRRNSTRAPAPARAPPPVPASSSRNSSAKFPAIGPLSTKDPIEFASRWYDSQISTSEGISTSTDFHHPFQIEGARWHLLRTIAGPRLGAELVPFISSEAQLQKSIDAIGKVHCIAWVVLSAARDLYGATHYLGGTAVTAPPFFDTAARSDALFWHPDPKYVSGFPADSPLVMAPPRAVWI
jgi:hypothetical protein